MFPEIVRDDIFRLETHRLWLRWPMVADLGAADVAASKPSGKDCFAQDADVELPGKTHIDAWRSEMERGSAIHLALALKGNDHDALGVVHVTEIGAGRFRLRYCLDETWRGLGLMTEAVQSVVDAAFLLAPLHEICASPAVLDPGGRRVLERCGFTYVGNGMRESRVSRGLIACDHFRLERKTWSSLKGWRFSRWGASSLANHAPPSMEQQRCVSA